MAGSQNTNLDNYFTCRYITEGVDVDWVAVVVPPQPDITDRIRIQQVPWEIAAPVQGQMVNGLTILARVINFRFVIGPEDKAASTVADHDELTSAPVDFYPSITLEVSYSDDLARAAGGIGNLRLACDDPLTKEWHIFGRDLVFGEKQGFDIDQARKCGIVTGITRWVDPHIAWVI